MLPIKYIRVEEGEKEKALTDGVMMRSVQPRPSGDWLIRQPGKGPNALQNLLHRVDVPIAEAHMELRQPITNRVFNDRIGPERHFAFFHVPNGTYSSYRRRNSSRGPTI